MALRQLGAFMRNFARDINRVTSGFEDVVGPGPDPLVSQDRVGRRLEMDAQRGRERSGPKLVDTDRKKRRFF